MIPEYLSNLQLSQVFATYTNTVDQFIQESTADELIVDSEIQKISGFVDTNFGQTEKVACKYFSVSNPTQKPYALLQIDNGIIQSSETKKCDCAIANDASLCFIEFKANANSSKLSTIAKNYKKAIEQKCRRIPRKIRRSVPPHRRHEAGNKLPDCGKTRCNGA